jgi:hypothetical protein
MSLVSLVCVMVVVMCGLVFMLGVVLVLMCVVVFIVVIVLMFLFLGCRLVSVVCLVVALLEELATQSMLLFGLDVYWGVWGGLVIMQGDI